MSTASHPHPHHFDDDAANDDDGERAYGYGIMSGTQAFTAARDEDMLRRRESGVSSGGGAGITAAQKMLAACSGSLLTSLLGARSLFLSLVVCASSSYV